MENNMRFLKLFSILSICTVYIFSFSHFGEKTFKKFQLHTESFFAGTPSSSINHEGKSDTEPKAEIKNRDSLKEKGKFANKSTDLLQNTDEQKYIVLEEVAVKPTNDQTELENAAKILSPLEIPPQFSFSFLEYCQKRAGNGISSQTLNKISSGIYQTILPTNFLIQERNIGHELPSFATLGLEAKVDQTQKMDFVFSNPNANPYILNLRWKRDELHIELTGKPFLNTYKILKQDEQHFPPKIIRQFSPLLVSGKSRIVEAGRDGMLVKVYRGEYNHDQLVKKEFVSEDFYPPVYPIEIHPLSTASENQISLDLNPIAQKEIVPLLNSQLPQMSPNSTNTSLSASINEGSLSDKPNQTQK